MRTAAVQFPVSMDVQANLAALTAAVAGIEPETLVVAPEGSLSGYEPVPGFVAKLDNGETNKAIASARQLAARANPRHRALTFAPTHDLEFPESRWSPLDNKYQILKGF